MTNPTPADVAGELRAEMARQGYSISLLADHADIPAKRLYARFKDPASLGLDELTALCGVLDLPISDLFIRSSRDAA